MKSSGKPKETPKNKTEGGSSFFGNFTLKQKTVLVLSINAAILVTVGLVLFNYLNEARRTWDEYQNETVARQTYLMEIKSQLGYGGFIHNFKNYVLRGQQKHIDRFENNRQALSQAIAGFNDLDLSNEEKKAIGDIESVAGDYIDNIVIVQKLVSEGKSSNEIDQTVKIDDSPAFRAFEVIDGRFKELELTNAEAMKSIIQTLLLVLIFSFIGLFAITTMFMWLLLTRSIIKPIGRTAAVVERLGQGDLTAFIEVSSKDEIGTMASTLNATIGKLRDVMKQILNSSGQVENAATQISSASEQLAAGAEEQQAQLSEVATTMEQMSAMILEASKNADETRQNAQHTGNTAEQGREVVSKTVTGFQTVADTVEQAAQQIQELNKRSEEIGNVIQVIDDIADQTNLLALNANIEAARAGEAGRGFAVVADEVRKLAERTVSATAEISKMIESIQGDIRAAVDSMEQIQGQSKDGLELVAQSDKSLQEISGAITGVVTAVEQIATSTNEQSSGAEQISKNIEGITTVAKESASSAQELASSAEQLNREVQGLNELIGQFKVD